MKKLVLMFAVVIAVSLSSCNSNKTDVVSAQPDSITVDTDSVVSDDTIITAEDAFDVNKVAPEYSLTAK